MTYARNTVAGIHPSGIERRSALLGAGRRNVLLMRFGLGVPRRRRTFVSNGNGVSRGDRNRNARLARLRALVLVENAIIGIDLADRKQMVVVCDHDSKVAARRTYRCKAWDLGAALDWAADRARGGKGFAGLTVACEPTGHRWRVLSELAARRSMLFVCVQPSVTSYSRRVEDLTPDKTDEKDAVLIANSRRSCAATNPNRSMRRGPGCGISVPAASS